MSRTYLFTHDEAMARDFVEGDYGHLWTEDRGGDVIIITGRTGPHPLRGKHPQAGDKLIAVTLEGERPLGWPWGPWNFTIGFLLPRRALKLDQNGYVVADER